MSDKLLVRSINEMYEETWEPLYWSNEWGWTGIEEADRFTEEEANAFSLPNASEWVYESMELGVDIPSGDGVENE